MTIQIRMATPTVIPRSTLVVAPPMATTTTRLVVLVTPVATLAIPPAQPRALMTMTRALMTMIHAAGLATTRLATLTLSRLTPLQAPFPLGALAR